MRTCLYCIRPEMVVSGNVQALAHVPWWVDETTWQDKLCPDHEVEQAAALLKSGCCKSCSLGLREGTLGRRLGYCSPKCRDKGLS